MDFNLYGMGYIRLSKALFRGTLPAEPHPPARGWLNRACALDPAAVQPPSGTWQQAPGATWQCRGCIESVSLAARA